MNGQSLRSYTFAMGLALILVAVLAPTYDWGDLRVGATAAAQGSSCMVVVSVNTATGLVTLKSLTTGAIEKFRADAKTIAGLRAGMVLNVRPSGGTSSGPIAAAGTTSCGSNVGRNQNTQGTPTEHCYTTDQNGVKHIAPCPSK